MILLVDNYDSFTFNLKDYLEQGGVDVEVVRNDDVVIKTLNINMYDGIVISPGPGRPDDAGFTLEIINQAAGVVPILGVCLGMQAIGQHFGARLEKAAYPMHGKTSELTFEKHPLFEGINAKLDVCRYHSLIITGIEHTELKTIAYSPLNEVMAISHPNMDIWGLQFHPEAILTQEGKQMVHNWIKSLNLQ